jgi:hypothetical protein
MFPVVIFVLTACDGREHINHLGGPFGDIRTIETRSGRFLQDVLLALCVDVMPGCWRDVSDRAFSTIRVRRLEDRHDAAL